MKKRNIVIGLIALEIVSIPVSAKVIDKVMHSFPDSVIATELPRQPGKTLIAVSSNKPFVITSSNHTGEFDIKITQTGMIYKTTYGEKAEMPGPAKTCSTTIGSKKEIIYTAEKRTAKVRGQILSQTVMVEINYAPGSEPIFEIVAEKKAEDVPISLSCDAADLAARPVQS